MGFQDLTATGPLPLPRWILYTKGAIILLSILILALAAYAISIHGGYTYYYSSGAPGFLIFLAIFTWIVHGGSTAIEIWAPQFYFRIAVFIAYILSVIFWLTGWAWSASWASVMLGDVGYYGPYKSYGSAMAACAALGAVVWVLVIVNLVFFCIACFRGGDSRGTANVELGAPQKPVADGTLPVAPPPMATQPAHTQQTGPVHSV